MSRAQLLVDVGNSRIKWVLATDSTWTPGSPFPTHDTPLAAALDGHWSTLQRPEAVVVSNVAGPGVAENIDSWVGRHWGIPVHYARSEARHGPVINGYSNPEQLGVDRWLGLLGLQAGYALPACLVDCGTAITLDLLDGQARHRGGLIAPGLMTMHRALQSDAHGLGGLELRAGAFELGHDTAGCIQAGCLMACAGLIEKTLVTLNKDLDAPIQLVLTGGDAVRVGDQLTIPFQFCADMVLRGLWGWTTAV
ncbi:MAG: type III pantothenate kinase [Methylococcaceae bacterium]|nr:type III pantothenate kinase [Methylococcaceae bacterium]